MIDSGLYVAFVAAVAILMLTPGPNVALIVGNSIALGTRFGLVTVAGTSSAMTAQLALTMLGMTELIATLGVWFEWVRWAGVAYLVYLGVAQWRKPAVTLAGKPPQATSARKVYGNALFVALTNPRTLLFFGAFFPQFIDPAIEIGPQVVLLSATFLALVCTGDTGWALAAGRARGLLASRGRLRNRIAGTLLIGAAIGLALARNQ